MDWQPRRWASFWAATGARGDAERLLADLDARYSEPHRFYHGWQHIRSCLDELDGAPGVCADPLAVELALWYHDAVYDPRAVDNEERSAALARDAALGMGLDDRAAGEAAALVRLTAHAAPPPARADAPADAAIMLDIDLCILGSAPPLFAAYEAAIRREYSFLSENEYGQGRTRVLQSFLERPRIYLTDFFGDRFEGQARENILQSLARLAAQRR